MQYASIGQRFLAAFMDGIILSIPLYAILYFSGLGSNNQDTQTQLLSQVIWLVVSVLYYVVFQGRYGQTLGKKAVGIKVVTKDGKTPDMLKFFLREEVGKFISSIILMLGYLMAIWDKDKQTLHDKIAGTYVIKVGTEQAPQPTTPVAPTTPAAPQTSTPPAPQQ